MKMKTNILLWVAVIAVAVVIYNPSILEAGIDFGSPSAISITVVSNNTGVSGATCYLNPAGSDKCMNSNPNSNTCMWKTTSSSGGVCTFTAAFNGTLSWPIGVICPASVGGRSIQKTITLVAGTTKAVVSCDGSNPDPTYPDGYDPELTKDEKNGPLCLVDIYNDEFCSDFDLSYYGVVNGKKTCAARVSYRPGNCVEEATSLVDKCIKTPYYETPTVCKTGYSKDGAYCCIAAIEPEKEYGDCSKFPGSHKVMTDGVPSCVKDLNLVEGECIRGSKQTVDGEIYCVVQPDVKNIGGDSVTKTITNTLTVNKSNAWAIILAFAGGGLVMYILGGGRIGRFHL